MYGLSEAQLLGSSVGQAYLLEMIREGGDMGIQDTVSLEFSTRRLDNIATDTRVDTAILANPRKLTTTTDRVNMTVVFFNRLATNNMTHPTEVYDTFAHALGEIISSDRFMQLLKAGAIDIFSNVSLISGSLQFTPPAVYSADGDVWDAPVDSDSNQPVLGQMTLIVLILLGAVTVSIVLMFMYIYRGRTDSTGGKIIPVDFDTLRGDKRVNHGFDVNADAPLDATTRVTRMPTCHTDDTENQLHLSKKPVPDKMTGYAVKRTWNFEDPDGDDCIDSSLNLPDEGGRILEDVRKFSFIGDNSIQSTSIVGGTDNEDVEGNPGAFGA